MTPAAAVVNFNAGDLLATCVSSLRAADVDPVVVLDNGSTDGSLDRLDGLDRLDLAGVTVIRGRANVGYGAGVNRAVAAIGGRSTGETVAASAGGSADAGALVDAPILVCNPDVVVHPGAVDRLVAALDRDPALGIVGPRLSNPDGSLYPSARTFPAMGDAIGHAFLGVIAPRNRFSRRYKLLDWDHASAWTVDWVSGACFLARRSTWDDLGGFDESYFMYMEDVDLCWRARRHGWRVGYEPAAEVTHVQGASTDQRAYRMIVAHHRSMFHYAATTTTGPARVLLPVMAAALVLRAGLACVHKWRDERRGGGAGGRSDAL